MPVLGKTDVKEVTLPSFDPKDPAIIKLNTSLTVGDIMVLNNDGKKLEGMAATIKIFSRIIISWNFTDESGQILPITEENIGKLKVADLYAIYNSLEIPKELLDESKKKVLSNF